jgi:hypothetical protein
MSDLIKKALVYQHFEPKSVVERLQAEEVAAANDIVATKEERSYSPVQEEYNAAIERLQALFQAQSIQYQNELNYAILSGQTSLDSSINQAKINQNRCK